MIIKTGKIQFRREEDGDFTEVIYDSYNDFLDNHPYDTFRAFCEDKYADVMWIKSGNITYKLSKQEIRFV